MKSFIQKLARVKFDRNDVFNHLSFGEPLNAVRRKNLELYLSDLASRKPTVLLIGEAPGYQGSRLTGVPFTSEHHIQTIPFFRNKSYPNNRHIFGVESF